MMIKTRTEKMQITILHELVLLAMQFQQRHMKQTPGTNRDVFIQQYKQMLDKKAKKAKLDAIVEQKEMRVTIN